MYKTAWCTARYFFRWWWCSFPLIIDYNYLISTSGSVPRISFSFFFLFFLTAPSSGASWLMARWFRRNRQQLPGRACVTSLPWITSAIVPILEWRRMFLKPSVQMLGPFTSSESLDVPPRNHFVRVLLVVLRGLHKTRGILWPLISNTNSTKHIVTQTMVSGGRMRLVRVDGEASMGGNKFFKTLTFLQKNRTTFWVSHYRSICRR